LVQRWPCRFGGRAWSCELPIMDAALVPSPVPSSRDGPGPRIRVRGLAQRYGTLEVFRGVDLDAGDRAILAIVGTAGCGKTTLLRCIDGLIPVDEGEIHVNGERVTQPIAGVAMVFQHFGLFPWKTVHANVAYGLKMAGASSREIAEKVPH